MLTNNQRELVYWILERDFIRFQKECDVSPPWTKDPVMQETYFCNVNREHDRVTKWIRKYWTYDLIHQEHYELAMVVARVFNLPETLVCIGQPKSDIDYWFKRTEDMLKTRKAEGRRIWNGAYIISTNGKKMDKLTYCLDMLKNIAKTIKTLYFALPEPYTLRDVHKRLTEYDGLGSFLAAQIVADLKNTEGHILQQAPDWMTWAAPGPGSLRGLEWFWERKVTVKTFEKDIQEAYAIIKPMVELDLDFPLCMQNFQNCFCEYDKYMRVKNGTGRSKRKYDGTGIPKRK